MKNIPTFSLNLRTFSFMGAIVFACSSPLMAMEDEWDGAVRKLTKPDYSQLSGLCEAKLGRHAHNPAQFSLWWTRFETLEKAKTTTMSRLEDIKNFLLGKTVEIKSSPLPSAPPAATKEEIKPVSSSSSYFTVSYEIGRLRDNLRREGLLRGGFMTPIEYAQKEEELALLEDAQRLGIDVYFSSKDLKTSIKILSSPKAKTSSAPKKPDTAPTFGERFKKELERTVRRNKEVIPSDASAFGFPNGQTPAEPKSTTGKGPLDKGTGK